MVCVVVGCFFPTAGGREKCSNTKTSSSHGFMLHALWASILCNQSYYKFYFVYIQHCIWSVVKFKFQSVCMT